MVVYGIHITGVKNSAALDGEVPDAQKFHQDVLAMKKADGSPLVMSVRGGRLTFSKGLSGDFQFCSIYECANEADQKETNDRIQKEASTGKWGNMDKLNSAFEQANVCFQDGAW
ncbi:hypothetical protein K523DRAFT_280033 [Schizophyllum commune Tattone D]|nr:hypothetical protein K525DRAFT_209628 [Schizophyllum commune Loenen D]KAI5826920.1 hypothetical protein K523DRAFT_280033 [Schizophyllum commune Tattone D]